MSHDFKFHDDLLTDLFRGALDPTADQRDMPPPDWLDEHFPYQPCEFAGRGGSGYVWKARHHETKKPVALKVIVFQSDIATARERWLREARIARSVKHPHLLAILDSGPSPDGTSAWLALEWIDGGDLQQHLESAGPLPWTRLHPWVLQICDGLRALHQAGLVHRDLKPSNLLLESQTDRLVVSDFGAALDLNEERVTRTTDALLSFGYAAPEQLKIGHTVDPRSDQYSLAATIWELLSGELPMGSFPKLKAPKSSIPFWLDRVLRKALSREPDHRYPDLESFRRALRRAPHLSRRILKITTALLILGGFSYSLLRLRNPPQTVVVQARDQTFRSKAVRVTQGLEIYLRFAITLSTTGDISGTVSTYSNERFRGLKTQGAFALMNVKGEAEVIIICPRLGVSGEWDLTSQSTRSDYVQTKIPVEMAQRITDIRFMAHEAYDQADSPWYRDFPDTPKQQVNGMLDLIRHDRESEERQRDGEPPIPMPIPPGDHRDPR